MASSTKKKTPAPAAKNASAKSAKSAKPAAKAAAPAKKAPAKTAAAKAPAAATNGQKSRGGRELTATEAILGNRETKRNLDPFIESQRQKLLQLRDAMVDSMAGVAQDTLRSRAEGSEASAFGMHQADAGSDAYDRDFALSLLSQEQDALYEIDQALKRIDLGTYGICEMSGKPIGHPRLEAIPFARFTVECQSQLEKQNKASRVRQSVTSLFGLTDEEGGEGEEEETKSDRDDSKD
jgi:RNA polymerase-binding transcription factor DksA